MITWILLISCLLALFFYYKRRELKKNGGNRFVYHLSDKSLDFLFPLIGVTLFYFILAWIFDGTSNNASLQFLIKLETFLSGIKSFLSKIKLGTTQVIIILIVMYALSLLRIPSKLTSKLLPFFKHYRKGFTRAYIAATLLCAFTFFGTQLGVPIAQLKLRIDSDKKGYADLKQQVHDALSAQVPAKLHERALG